MIDGVWDASKAAASACEKGGRWLLSLELLREAKVFGVRVFGGFENGRILLNAPDSKKNGSFIYIYIYDIKLLYLWYAYYIIYVLWLTSLFSF